MAHLALFTAANAVAADTCVDRPARKWCLGTVIVNGDATHAEATVFANEDLLVEVTEQGRTERMLKRAGDKNEVYFGLSDEEQARGTVGLKFSLEGFAWMVLPLAIAFPDGPSSVPTEPVEKHIDAPGANMHLLIWRLPGDRIAFRLLAPAGVAARTFSGEFHGQRPQALAGEVVAAWGPPMQSSPFVRLTPPPHQSSSH